MVNIKKWSLFIASSLILAACGGTLEQGSETESITSIESSSVVESSQENVDEESVSEESSETESETQLNEDEAALIDRALTKISDMTGYSEEEGYMYIIHPVEAKEVTVEVRENQEETASMIGMFKYDDETKNVQEMDMITGEFVDYPAE